MACSSCGHSKASKGRSRKLSPDMKNYKVKKLINKDGILIRKTEKT